MNSQPDPFQPALDLRVEPIRRDTGHGNAAFLAALQEPGQTKAKLRDRVKAGEFPHLWKGCGEWIELAGVK